MERRDVGEDFVRELVCHQPSLYAYILTLLPNRDLANDVLQETCIEAWQKSGEFAQGTNFLAWACRIAHFKVLACRRDLGRERLVFDEQLLADIAVEVQEQSRQAGEYPSALDDCLAELSESQRRLILERYGPGGSLRQVAAALGRTSASLAVSLHRVRRVLMECVERKIAGGSR
jgi:RNA polymerase sigma-70 factor, ECF subfamily